MHAIVSWPEALKRMVWGLDALSSLWTVAVLSERHGHVVSPGAQKQRYACPFYSTLYTYCTTIQTADGPPPWHTSPDAPTNHMNRCI
jgi:hypothetical protein